MFLAMDVQQCRLSAVGGGVSVQAQSPTPTVQDAQNLYALLYESNICIISNGKKGGDKHPYVQQKVTASKHNKGRRQYCNREIPMAVKS